MRTVVEVQTGAGVVHVSRGAYEFQATFHGVNAHLVALCYGLEHNMAAMDRIERRLIACLDTTAPAERDAKDVLAAAVGLLMFERAMEASPTRSRRSGRPGRRSTTRSTAAFEIRTRRTVTISSCASRR